MKFYSLIITAFLFAATVNAETYYVSPTGSNAANGQSQATAFLTLQHASDVVSPGDSVIVLAGTYSGFYHSTSGTVLQKITFHAMPGAIINSPNATTNDGINIEGASYIVVEGFKVINVPRAGIRSVINDHVVIRNNVCDQNGVWGILTGFSDDIIIENNECSRSVQQHGIYFSNSADNPIIRNNTCWGNSDCGIHMNGDISLGGDGIISNALVEKNILYDNGVGGGSAINCDGVQNSIIQNNLAYNNHASGISLYQIDGGAPSSGNLIVNNTILQPSDGRWALNISDGSINNIAFNNIFYSMHSFRGSISIDAASLNGFKSNFNVQTNRMSNDGGNTNMTLAQWQQATQHDSNSAIATPASLFVNASTGNYHLLSASPAINLGRSSYYSKAAPLTDLDNNIRPNGIYPDAGAYEFTGTTGIEDLSTQSTSWNDIATNEIVKVVDVNGKMVFDGIKSRFDQRLFSNAVYLIYIQKQKSAFKVFVSN
jgi:parallel beta-helix repeat protein